MCLDASQVQGGKPHVVWKREGIKAKFASPVLLDGRLYIPDDVANLFCLDAKSGSGGLKALFRDFLAEPPAAPAPSPDAALAEVLAEELARWQASAVCEDYPLPRQMATRSR